MGIVLVMCERMILVYAEICVRSTLEKPLKITRGFLRVRLMHNNGGLFPRFWLFDEDTKQVHHSSPVILPPVTHLIFFKTTL